MSANDSECLKNLIKEIDKGNNFIDFFLTIGLSTKLLFDDWLYENSIETIKESKLFEPELINKFPPVDKSTINIDENIINHCFPNGYFPVESQVKPKEVHFSLILDNSYYGVQFPQKYISCIIFYESFESYYKVYQRLKMASFNKENFKTEPLHKQETSSFSGPFASYSKSENIDEKNLLSSNSNQVYLNFAEESNSRLSYSNIRNKFKNYYAPKCICLVSVHPFLDDYSRILSGILKFVTNNSRVLKPIEKIIDNLVLEVPVPPRGLYKVEFSFFNEKYVLTQPKTNNLPMTNYKFPLMFSLLDLSSILEVFKHIILETRIAFFSSSINYLTPVIQGFIQTIFPFRYSYQYITVLPEENFIFLESITPFIVGINKLYSSSFFDNYKLEVNDINLLIVDLDSGNVELKLDSTISAQSEDKRKKYLKAEFPDLPEHYRKKLFLRISEELLTLKNSKSKTPEEIDKFIANVRNYFFQFVVNILQKYNEFLNNQYYTNNDIGTPTINSLFFVKDFLKTKSASDIQFMNKLVTESQTFLDFIYRRMIPKDSKEKLEIVFLEENLFCKYNRQFRFMAKKKETPFLESKAYDYKSTHRVNPSRGLNEQERKKFQSDLDQNLKYKCLKLGQEVILEGKEIYFSYHFFPIFNNNLFFFNNIKEYYIPIVLSDDVDSLNTEVVSKSHLNTTKSLQHEMENNIYLCWMMLWAMTFWYHDEKEKRNRFHEMLSVIEKVYYHEIEVFNLIFEALMKYGEEFMVLKLFERLIHLRLNPSYLICRLVMKILDKEKFQLNKNSTNIVKYVKENEYRVSSINNFVPKPRTFKYPSDHNIAHSDIFFSFEDICINCNQVINLDEISRNFQNMTKDFEWATCTNCEIQILPKFSINIGIEYNATGDLAVSHITVKILFFS